ncbi:MAG: glycosyltransferase family 4 protein [Bacteroidota bacterium]
MKLLKILHLSSEVSWRGGEQQIAYLIEELVSAGHTCEILGRDNSAFEHYARKENLRFHGVSYSGVGLIKTAFLLKKISSKYDIVHAHSGKSHTLTFLALLAGMRTPVVLSRRVDFVPKKNFFTQWKYNHLGIKRIIGVSNAITEIMRSYMTKKRERCITIHSGIDLRRFSDIQKKSLRSILELPKGCFLLGNTSALADHKDYFSFLKVAEVLSNKDAAYHFVIMGDGPMANEVKSFARDLNLMDRVTFTGFLNTIPEVLGDLNVFLMTSKTEGLGTSILDAFASRVPVVATKAGGIPEMVIHESTGLIADVGDVDTLAKNVERLKANVQLAQELVSNASSKLLEFTKEKTAKRTLDIYYEILNTSG